METLQPPQRKITLKANRLSKTFYHPVKIPLLQGIDLVTYQGESLAIMGRSGEGKSTLLHLLGTLDQPCSGTLTIADQEVSSFNKTGIRNRHIGFIFQSFHLLEDYTVLDNILMPARIARKNAGKGSPIYQRGWGLLEHVGLAHRAHFNTKLLSGGEKQRVAIARALINDPDLILADEPSGNLDRQTSMGIQDLLFNFVKDHQKTLIVVTHDRELAESCNRLLFLKNGLLQEE